MVGGVVGRYGTVGALLAVAAALAIATWAPATATAKTEVRDAPAQLVFRNGARPDDPGNCSAAAFVMWQEPRATVRAFPVAWRVFWTVNGRARSKDVRPPFDDTFRWVIDYQVPGGSHWTNVGITWSDGPRPNDCSSYSVRQQAMIDPAVRVEITWELQDPRTDPARCRAARATLRARNRAVGRLLGALRNATSDRQRARIRTQLTRARNQRAQAAQRVARACG